MSAVLDQRPAAAKAAAPSHAQAVRAHNDAFRRSFVGGQVVETPGLTGLHEDDRFALLLAVLRFDQFNADNDPYGEHDFGAIDVAGQRFFWKIDAYDQALLGHSPEPTDPSVTVSVLTIMRTEEY